MHENDRVERFNGNGVRLGLWQNHNVFEESGIGRVAEEKRVEAGRSVK